MTSRVLCILIKSVALRTTLVRHFPRSGDVIHPQLRESGSGYETTSIIENRHLAYPCFEADNDSAKSANQNTKIDSNTALILFISPLYKHSPRHTTMVCACCLHNATPQSFWRGGY